ncbi:hypothetical protein BZL39_B09960 [Zygosaccharomyces parabailii]|nr:hypothetical protein BZL39_B09960 [Zygosaccharomyces parabailii]
MSGNQGKGNTKVGQEEPTLPDNVMDYFSLKGKVAIVTGASGGIGYQVSLALAQKLELMWLCGITQILRLNSKSETYPRSTL